MVKPLVVLAAFLACCVALAASVQVAQLEYCNGRPNPPHSPRNNTNEVKKTRVATSYKPAALSHASLCGPKVKIL